MENGGPQRRAPAGGDRETEEKDEGGRMKDECGMGNGDGRWF